jgi:hypothetical protein
MDIDFVDESVVLSDGLITRLIELIDNKVIGFLVKEDDAIESEGN